MIRPLTIATLVMACSSGLYLYQSKHEVQLLDRTIERTVHETIALREQSRLLATEWTMLNDPERLRRFSDTYMTLKTTTPSQFTSLADLDSRLPAVQAEVAPRGDDEPVPVPVSLENASPAVIDSAPVPGPVEDEILPVPPVPASPAVASAARPAVSKPAAAESQPHAVADARPSDRHFADQHMADQHLADQHLGAARVVEAHSDSRPPVTPPPRPVVLATSRPVPAVAPAGPPAAPRAFASAAPAPAPAPSMAAPAAAPYAGSLLGMARAGQPPPRPTPVNASYNSN